MNARSLFLGTALLVLLVPAVHGDESTPYLFGYKLGQQYEITDNTEFRLRGVVVANPAGLTDGLDELLLTVTPKTHTIIGIYGTVRFHDVAQMKTLEDQYWELLRAHFGGWQSSRLGIGEIGLWKSSYWVRARTLRTRTKGLFEFSVSLEYLPGTPERWALDVLRIEETRQMITDHQSSGL